MCKCFVCGTSDFGSVVKYGLGLEVVISVVVGSWSSVVWAWN